MNNPNDNIEVFGKRSWYYSWGVFMLFDSVVHFFAACLLLHYLWLLTYGSEFAYARDPEYGQAISTFGFVVVYCTVYGILCLLAAKFCRSRLLKPTPGMTITARGLVIDTFFERYSVDWDNVSAVTSGKAWPLKEPFTAISLNSENVVYSAKHAPWTRVSFMINKLRNQAPVVLFPSGVLQELPAINYSDLKTFYETSQALHLNAANQS